ncbi:MAG: hypothetical protein CVU89_16595 [Firmicutes bacterium HGW-Firmicutes-14]|nr:MAG: hypothetical protein CVU89_16595 [Firmicutes bacterium HGW-Firmicutes-14]
MSLINCPECNKQISDKAEACPYCGLPGSYFSTRGDGAKEACVAETGAFYVHPAPDTAADELPSTLPDVAPGAQPGASLDASPDTEPS